MARKPVCPICDKPTAVRFAPFCSSRCADVDLGRWFGETYRMPATPPELNDDEEGVPGDLGG
jgi:endogenous inhibitor of DNA gyrase (YacG/DUF329 family)